MACNIADGVTHRRSWLITRFSLSGCARDWWRCGRVRRDRRSALEVLRIPLEDGEIRLARRDGLARYPARFQLVLASNLCPCAPADPQDCICAAAVKRRYLGRLSGPLLDRVDLRVQMHAVRAGAFHDQDGEPTAVVRQRVAAARDAAAERWRAIGVRTNAEVPGPLLRRSWRRWRPTSAPSRRPQRSAPARCPIASPRLSKHAADRTVRQRISICWPP